jgi:hypothetical protein
MKQIPVEALKEHSRLWNTITLLLIGATCLLLVGATCLVAGLL